MRTAKIVSVMYDRCDVVGLVLVAIKYRSGALNMQLDIYLYSNKLHSIDIFYKQHIKIFVLSKTLKTSPTCFGHYLTIIMEILYLS